jgi:hypothetical protein
MIRKCGSCRFFYKEYQSCSATHVLNAYDHNKKIFLTVGENLYCEKHQFKNEATLKAEAVKVEFDGVAEAMAYIERAKTLKDKKRSAVDDDAFLD